MKLIQGMKSIKELQRKADDLKLKVSRYCAISSQETATYTDQKAKIGEWIQSHQDTLKEILRLRVSIQKTNLNTQVTVELGGNAVTKSIAEWIHRRRDLAESKHSMFRALTDRNIKEGKTRNTSGDEIEVKINRFYDPVERDNKIELYRSEPMTIDATLEVTNAITDLIE